MKNKKLGCVLLGWLSLSMTIAHTEEYSTSESGVAAYYSNVFQGRKTASGQRYDKNKMTAAHKTYPFGTKLKVTNQENGKSVEVTVNDRGPTTPGRVIDLSRSAANELGYLKKGLANVTLEVVELGKK